MEFLRHSLLKIPPRLTSGDKAVIVSPSGCVDLNLIEGAKAVLESWGLCVDVALNADKQYGRFGGTVAQRLTDLQEAMNDQSVKLIMCSRGGYGIVHLLEDLDFEKIQKHPKWLVGFSDITALHLALMQAGIASLHAPMARHLTQLPYDAATALMHKALFDDQLSYNLYSRVLNRNGKAKGQLFGGNLAVLSALIGTPYMQLSENPILFIEDVGEAPYKIDRMMWQLKLSGILEQLSGLIVGQFSAYNEDPLMGIDVYDAILEMVSVFDYPVVFDFPVGHVEDNYPLIHGAMISLSVDHKSVKLKFDK